MAAQPRISPRSAHWPGSLQVLTCVFGSPARGHTQAGMAPWPRHSRCRFQPRRACSVAPAARRRPPVTRPYSHLNPGPHRDSLAEATPSLAAQASAESESQTTAAMNACGPSQFTALRRPFPAARAVEAPGGPQAHRTRTRTGGPCWSVPIQLVDFKIKVLQVPFVHGPR